MIMVVTYPPVLGGEVVEGGDTDDSGYTTVLEGHSQEVTPGERAAWRSQEP